MAADRHQSSVRLLFLVWTCVTNLLSSTDGHFIPEFERPASNFTVTLGQQAILTCHVIHLGGYKVGWIKSDTKAIQAIHLTVVTHNHRVAVRHYGSSSWQLILNDVKREDEGEYMCQINTNPMKSQIFFLRVVVPPEIDFSETTNEVMIAEGSSLKLGCKAKGVPIPVVRWHREDGEDITIRTPLGERHRCNPQWNLRSRFSIF